MPEDSEGLEVGPRAISLPLTKEMVGCLPWGKMGAFPAFPEIARRHPEAMAVVLPILDFFSRSYAPLLLQSRREGGDKENLVPSVNLENEEQRLRSFREYVQNICILDLTTSIEDAADKTDWRSLAQCLPLADYPTAVYLKKVIDSTIDKLTHRVLFKVWRESVYTKDPEECRKALWEILCPQIPYSRVGKVADDELDWPPPPERFDCPSFISDRCRREHTDAHLDEFLKIAKGVDVFLTPRERKILAYQRERGREFGIPPDEKFWEDLDYQAIAWAAFYHGLEVPLDRFRDPKAERDKSRLNADRSLHLFNMPGVKKPIIVVAVYPHGRHKEVRLSYGRRLAVVNIISCYPLDDPRSFYDRKVGGKGKSSWSYLEFAQQLWVHSVRRWAEDPENSFSPREVQRRHLSVERVYGVSSFGGGA